MQLPRFAEYTYLPRFSLNSPWKSNHILYQKGFLKHRFRLKLENLSCQTTSKPEREKNICIEVYLHKKSYSSFNFPQKSFSDALKKSAFNPAFIADTITSLQGVVTCYNFLKSSYSTHSDCSTAQSLMSKCTTYSLDSVSLQTSATFTPKNPYSSAAVLNIYTLKYYLEIKCLCISVSASEVRSIFK